MKKTNVNINLDINNSKIKLLKSLEKNAKLTWKTVIEDIVNEESDWWDFEIIDELNKREKKVSNEKSYTSEELYKELKFGDWEQYKKDSEVKAEEMKLIMNSLSERDLKEIAEDYLFDCRIDNKEKYRIWLTNAQNKENKVLN
ncbi:MAG: hypothetical protein AD073_000320 [Mycoplasmataceae bacterium]|nr:MAG: hypothetical protein AD073_000320 [Mycoplasmataceae bacterium]